MTIPYTPEQNGVAERKLQSLVSAAQSMLEAADLPHSYWAEAVATTCYLQNRSYHSSLAGNKTPYELWTGHKPDLGHLVYLDVKLMLKFPNRREKSLMPLPRNTFNFLGYGEDMGVKGYCLYNPKTKKFFFSRNVHFDEDSLLHSPSHSHSQTHKVKWSALF